MITKEFVLKKIQAAGIKGVTKSEITGEEKDSQKIEKYIKELIKEGKVVKEEGRFFLSGVEPGKNYITRGELEEHLQDVFALISNLNERLDRVYEYIDDIFINLRSEISTMTEPSVDDLRIIYDNLNANFSFRDSVPVPLFKDDVMGKFSISEERLNFLLLDLDKKEIIYLQSYGKQSEPKDKDRGIKSGNKILYYITWIKK